MDKIVDSVWIGSLAEASDLPLLRSHNIAAIVSVGCESAKADDINYCCYPELLDMPETNLLAIFKSTSGFIDAQVRTGKQVLVHCVYGQSRSASVIAAYLVMCTGRSLECALDVLKEKHSSICINPGFLSQLHLLASKDKYMVEFDLMVPPQIDELKPVDDISDFDKVDCAFCGFQLASMSDILQVRDNDDFMLSRTDPFWSDYKSPNRRKGSHLSVLKREYLVLRKTDIFVKQYDKDLEPVTGGGDNKRKRGKSERVQIPLCCPNCNKGCGYYSPSSILLCNDFILGDLVALLSASVKLVPAPLPICDVELVDEDNDEEEKVSDDEKKSSSC